MQAVNTLTNVAAVQLDISVWSGRKKLRPEDLRRVSGGDIPPDKLATLGSKKTIDPSALKAFYRLRKKAERTLSQYGVRFLGGWAVPIEKINEVCTELDSVRTEFEQEKQLLLQNYSRLVDEWCQEFTEWEAVIRAAVEPVSTVDRGLRFGYQAFQVNPVSTTGGEGSDPSSGLHAEAEGLSSGLLGEIAREAQGWWDNSLSGANELSQRGLARLSSIRDKLNAWSFMDVWPEPLVDQIDAIRQNLPRSGPVTDPQLTQLQALCLLLSDPDRARKHGETILARGPVTGSELVQSFGSQSEDWTALLGGGDAPSIPDREPSIPETTPEEEEHEAMAEEEDGWFF